MTCRERDGAAGTVGDVQGACRSECVLGHSTGRPHNNIQHNISIPHTTHHIQQTTYQHSFLAAAAQPLVASLQRLRLREGLEGVGHRLYAARRYLEGQVQKEVVGTRPMSTGGTLQLVPQVAAEDKGDAGGLAHFAVACLRVSRLEYLLVHAVDKLSQELVSILLQQSVWSRSNRPNGAASIKFRTMTCYVLGEGVRSYLSRGAELPAHLPDVLHQESRRHSFG